MKKSKSGFTLIELLVVIAIIGILSSVVLASLNSARSKSRDARRISDIKQLQLALELYYDLCGKYPTGNTIFVNPGTVGCGLSGALSVGSLVANGFISKIPKDPLNDSPYSYAGINTDSSAATCEGYHLGATLENNHIVLTSDNDATAISPACTGSTDFSGADGPPYIYDVKP